MLNFWHRCRRFTLSFSCPKPGVSHGLQEAWSFPWCVVFRQQAHLSEPTAVGLSPFPGPWEDRAKKYICFNPKSIPIPPILIPNHRILLLLHHSMLVSSFSHSRNTGFQHLRWGLPCSVLPSTQYLHDYYSHTGSHSKLTELSSSFLLSFFVVVLGIDCTEHRKFKYLDFSDCFFIWSYCCLKWVLPHICWFSFDFWMCRHEQGYNSRVHTSSFTKQDPVLRHKMSQQD